MSQLGEIEVVEVIKADGSRHKIKLQTVAVERRAVPTPTPEPESTPASESSP